MSTEPDTKAERTFAELYAALSGQPLAEDETDRILGGLSHFKRGDEGPGDTLKRILEDFEWTGFEFVPRRNKG